MERDERDANRHWAENPALDPTRQWENTPEVVTDLHLLIKRLSPERLDLLRTVADSPHVQVTKTEEAQATFLNKVAEAFGFVPMITIDGRTCSLVPEIRAPLYEAFKALEHDRLPKGPR